MRVVQKSKISMKGLTSLFMKVAFKNNLQAAFKNYCVIAFNINKIFNFTKYFFYCLILNELVFFFFFLVIPNGLVRMIYLEFDIVCKKKKKMSLQFDWKVKGK